MSVFLVIKVVIVLKMLTNVMHPQHLVRTVGRVQTHMAATLVLVRMASLVTIVKINRKFVPSVFTVH